MTRAYELTRPGNPAELTINQHVFPKASIERFADVNSGRVQLFDKIRSKSWLAKPDNQIFCAKRKWHQGAEAGYMQSFEGQFQALASQIIAGQVTAIGAPEKGIVDAFFALWMARAELKESEDREIKSSLVIGSELTKAQEENLESNGYIFVRKGGELPSRMAHGMAIWVKVRQYVHDLSGVRWSILSADPGQFLVPDHPTRRMLIPLAPTLCLCSGGQSGRINAQNLAEINRVSKETSVEYYFAQDLAQCLG
jgi:hypothetical protein